MRSRYPSWALEFTPVFRWVWILVFCVVICRSLFVLLSFFFWPLRCLLFDLWLLITPLVSSNFFFLCLLLAFYFFDQEKFSNMLYVIARLFSLKCNSCMNNYSLYIYSKLDHCRIHVTIRLNYIPWDVTWSDQSQKRFGIFMFSNMVNMSLTEHCGVLLS